MHDSLIKGVRPDDPEWGVATIRRSRKRKTIKRQYFTVLGIALTVISLFMLKAAAPRDPSVFWFALSWVFGTFSVGSIVVSIIERSRRDKRRAARRRNIHD